MLNVVNNVVQIKYLFSFKKSLKQSTDRFVLSSFCETTSLLNFNKLINKYVWMETFFFSIFYLVKETRELVNCLLKDMIHLVCMWRQIRGYPQGGNTTHTNSNTSKKNKLLLNFRVQQYFKMFGQKSRNIYPTLVKAEYNNRLWHYNWHHEWHQASIFAKRMAYAGNKAGFFNPVLLAGNQTNGYKRFGKASKIGKAKKLVKLYTLGVPLLFARFVYWSRTPRGFPKIQLKDEVNKRLGKKLRRRDYRK